MKCIMLKVLLGSLGSLALVLDPTHGLLHRHHNIMVSRSVEPSCFKATTSETERGEQKFDTIEMQNPRLHGLALQLDEGTRKSHSMAQNSAFVTGFFKGISKPESYRNLLTSLYFVYQAMEEALDNIPDERVKKLDDSVLRRLPALEEDMEFFYGKNWKSQVLLQTGQSSATKSYVARIQEIADESKGMMYLMIAHQYTRYLGDLFGGQMMGRMATRSMNLPSNKGVAFYNFDDISSTKDYITDWYQRLNDLELTDHQKQRIVDEANLVFDLNIGILNELDGSPLVAIWTMAMSTLKERLGLISN